MGKISFHRGFLKPILRAKPKDSLPATPGAAARSDERSGLSRLAHGLRFISRNKGGPDAPTAEGGKKPSPLRTKLPLKRAPVEPVPVEDDAHGVSARPAPPVDARPEAFTTTDFPPLSAPKRSVVPGREVQRPGSAPVLRDVESSPRASLSSATGRRYSLDEVVLDLPDFYTVQATLPVEVWPDSVREHFPFLIAQNRDHLFFEGPDGKVRRYPVDLGAFSGRPADHYIEGADETQPGWATIGEAVMRDKQVIYDAHRDAIVGKPIAEYTLDLDTATMAFEVNGRKVKSVLDSIGVYSLPGNKWMVPQPELRACTYACTEMLLAEGKSLHKVTQQMADFVDDMMGETTRQTLEEEVAALESKAGRRAYVVKNETRDAAESIALLEEALARNGPCILSIQGHDRILDKIEHGPDGAVLSVRDPFTGSCLRIKDHEGFWAPRETGSGKLEATRAGPRTWEAIFLPPESAGSPAPVSPT